MHGGFLRRERPTVAGLEFGCDSSGSGTAGAGRDPASFDLHSNKLTRSPASPRSILGGAAGWRATLSGRSRKWKRWTAVRWAVSCVRRSTICPCVENDTHDQYLSSRDDVMDGRERNENQTGRSRRRDRSGIGRRSSTRTSRRGDTSPSGRPASTRTTPRSRRVSSRSSSSSSWGAASSRS